MPYRTMKASIAITILTFLATAGSAYALPVNSPHIELRGVEVSNAKVDNLAANQLPCGYTPQQKRAVPKPTAGAIIKNPEGAVFDEYPVKAAQYAVGHDPTYAESSEKTMKNPVYQKVTNAEEKNPILNSVDVKVEPRSGTESVASGGAKVLPKTGKYPGDEGVLAVQKGKTDAHIIQTPGTDTPVFDANIGSGKISKRIDLQAGIPNGPSGLSKPIHNDFPNPKNTAGDLKAADQALESAVGKNTKPVKMAENGAKHVVDPSKVASIIPSSSSGPTKIVKAVQSQIPTSSVVSKVKSAVHTSTRSAAAATTKIEKQVKSAAPSATPKPSGTPPKDRVVVNVGKVESAAGAVLGGTINKVAQPIASTAASKDKQPNGIHVGVHGNAARDLAGAQGQVLQVKFGDLQKYMQACDGKVHQENDLVDVCMDARLLPVAPKNTKPCPSTNDSQLAHVHEQGVQPLTGIVQLCVDATVA